MTGSTVAKKPIVGALLEPFVRALLQASGISEDQAKICLLYALSTFRSDLQTIPLLAVIGMTGTGKSSLLDQMAFVVKNRKRSTATSYATTRDELENCTYIIDEADKVSEGLLQRRTAKLTSKMTHKVGTGHGWENKTADVFGATILARRTPFKDSAVRNRAIVIHTQNNPGEYKITDIKGLEEIAEKMDIERMTTGSGRVQDTWMPLLEVAKAIDDPSYEEAVNKAIEAEQTIFKSGQDYESSEVVLSALDKETWNKNDSKRLNKDIGLPKLTATINELGDVKLSNKQVEEILLTLGFKVTYTHGEKFVRSNIELLESLLEGVLKRGER